ncbi:Ig-like domain-containing protein, partial [Limnohabitans planktonicus]
NKFTDAAGNQNADGADANNTVSFNLDVTPPTIIVSSDKTDLLAGETATITFTLSEASNNFTASDVTVNGGTLSGFVQSATNPLVYTATFTPTSTAASAMILVSSNTFSDAAGNLNKDGSDLNNAVALKTNCPPPDTAPPTIAITSDKTDLLVGQTATITFTLSEASSDFTASDITVNGGTLSGFVQSATNPLVYTATFTPTSTAASAMILVSSNTFSDAAGNLNKDGSDLNNAVALKTNCPPPDTAPPTIAISTDKTALGTGQTAMVTFTLSEASS